MPQAQPGRTGRRRRTRDAPADPGPLTSWTPSATPQAGQVCLRLLQARPPLPPPLPPARGRARRPTGGMAHRRSGTGRKEARPGGLLEGRPSGRRVQAQEAAKAAQLCAGCRADRPGGEAPRRHGAQSGRDRARGARRAAIRRGGQTQTQPGRTGRAHRYSAAVALRPGAGPSCPATTARARGAGGPSARRDGPARGREAGAGTTRPGGPVRCAEDRTAGGAGGGRRACRGRPQGNGTVAQRTRRGRGDGSGGRMGGNGTADAATNPDSASQSPASA